MSELRMDSMRVPYSKVIGNVRWMGEYVLLLPIQEDGSLHPYMEMFGGYRNRTGRAVHFDRSKYMPHQGKKERRRRTSTKIGRMLRDYPWLAEVNDAHN